MAIAPMSNEPESYAPERVYANNRIVEFIDRRLDELKKRGKPALVVARESGYTHANIMSMFRKGRTKVPLDKVIELSRALEVDPAILLPLVLEQFWPTKDLAIHQMMNRMVSVNELAIVEHIRSVTSNKDPELTPAIKAGLTEVFTAAPK